MARKRTSAARTDSEPTLAPEQAAQMLRSHVAKGQDLLESRPITSANEQAWETVCHDLLIRAFGSASPNIERVMGVGRYDFTFGGGNETTIMGIIEALLIAGCVVQGDPEGDHYGPVSISKPDQRVQRQCERRGKRIAELTKKLTT